MEAAQWAVEVYGSFASVTGGPGDSSLPMVWCPSCHSGHGCSDLQ